MENIINAIIDLDGAFKTFVKKISDEYMTEEERNRLAKAMDYSFDQVETDSSDDQYGQTEYNAFARSYSALYEALPKAQPTGDFMFDFFGIKKAE